MMKEWKRFQTLALAAALAFSMLGLSACGSEEKDVPSTQASQDKASDADDENSANNDGGAAGAGSGDEAAGEADAAATPTDITVTLKETNSWAGDGGTNIQYDITVANGSDAEISDWALDIEVPEGTGIVQSWNVTPTLSGTTLTLVPADYALKIAPGQASQGLGLIAVTSGEWQNYTISYTTDGQKLVAKGTSGSAAVTGGGAAVAGKDDSGAAASAAETDQAVGKAGGGGAAAKDNSQAGVSSGTKSTAGKNSSAENGSSSGKNTATGKSASSGKSATSGKSAGSGKSASSGSSSSAKQGGEGVKTSAASGLSALSVKGAHLVNAKGQPVRLFGPSTHGIAWFPQYVNKAAFQTFRDDWGANCIRLAMYTAESGGYCTGGDKGKLKSLIENGVSYATELGMYVIIDWHVLQDQNPQTYQSEAVSFFDEMSKKYAGQTNVLYEICNEPNGNVSWSGNVKPYAEAVIPVIRKNSPNAVIIVGTPTWSQDVDKAAADPLKFANVMYAFHFYAGTHKDDLRKRVDAAVAGGLPVFITECSITDASGNGACDKASAEAWKALIEKDGLSVMEWSISNKAESSAILKSSCQKTSGFTEADLNESGAWYRSMMRSFAGKQ